MPRKSKQERAEYMRQYRQRKRERTNHNDDRLATERLQLLQTIRAIIGDARRGIQAQELIERYQLTSDELKEILQLASDLRY